MASFVQHIIDGSEFSFLIVIKDSADANGRTLLRCSAIQLLNRVDEVHVFLFDTSPTVFLCGFEQAVRSRFICHDGWSDPLGWDDGSFSKDCTIVNLDDFAGFKTHLEHHRTTTEGKSVAVMIDSLSPVIIHKSVGYVCKALHQLCLTAGNEGITQVICLLHQDTHDASTASAVSHIADTVLDLEPCRITTPLPEDPVGVCDLTHKRKSGKIIRLKEILTVDHNYRLHLFTDRQMANINSRAVEPQVKSTANLTFNLNLKESERRAKDRVVLPYTKVQQRHEYGVISGNFSEESGKIFYEPDDVDDFDEEDPDDDLDI